jgi:hypothetical protein
VHFSPGVPWIPLLLVAEQACTGPGLCLCPRLAVPPLFVWAPWHGTDKATRFCARSVHTTLMTATSHHALPRSTHAEDGSIVHASHSGGSGPPQRCLRAPRTPWCSQRLALGWAGMLHTRLIGRLRHCFSSACAPSGVSTLGCARCPARGRRAAAADAGARQQGCAIIILPRSPVSVVREPLCKQTPCSRPVGRSKTTCIRISSASACGSSHARGGPVGWASHRAARLALRTVQHPPGGAARRHTACMLACNTARMFLVLAAAEAPKHAMSTM